mgnify:CR=1 FL=1
MTSKGIKKHMKFHRLTHYINLSMENMNFHRFYRLSLKAGFIVLIP